VSETRKIAAILVADVVGYSRLPGAEKDRTLPYRDRGGCSDLIDPVIATNHGRIVKRTCYARYLWRLDRAANVPTQRRHFFAPGDEGRWAC
jgi:hypothetical protein